MTARNMGMKAGAAASTKALKKSRGSSPKYYLCAALPSVSAEADLLGLLRHLPRTQTISAIGPGLPVDDRKLLKGLRPRSRRLPRPAAF